MAKFTREEARIKAVQQKYFKAHNYRKPSNVLSFFDWFKAQLQHFEDIGADYELVGQCVFVKYPESEMNAFTVDDFQEEYKVKYLRQKPQTSISQGCSA